MLEYYLPSQLSMNVLQSCINIMPLLLEIQSDETFNWITMIILWSEWCLLLVMHGKWPTLPLDSCVVPSGSVNNCIIHSLYKKRSKNKVSLERAVKRETNVWWSLSCDISTQYSLSSETKFHTICTDFLFVQVSVADPGVAHQAPPPPLTTS